MSAKLQASIEATKRVRLDITGIVQGVGFRPFVYRWATELGLLGLTFNHSKGVTVELQGTAQAIEAFVEALNETPPPLARIDSLSQTEIPLQACDSFEITHSQADAKAVVAVSSDKSSCQACLDEIMDPSNRHYQYPFTNCTNCGPRYTLIRALPYDRPNTTMAEFAMCDACAAAYQDPLDRRYHAQPVSCPDCGPQLRLLDAGQMPLAERNDALDLAVELLAQGKTLAIKGLGGFHLVCDATNDEAVQRLRRRKQRPAKPFAVMCASVEMAQKLATGSDAEWQLLQSAERPITLLQKSPSCDLLSPAVAPGIDRLGLFLPYTPLHQLLLTRLNRPLVATSANRSGEPIITHAEDIFALLGEVVDAVLDHNREILNGCDDSVVQMVDDKLQVIRLARGYAPLTLALPQAVPQETLAVGAQQKNSIAFGFDHNLVLSPHIGDLFSLEAEQYFIDTLATFKRLYQFSAKHLVSDKHPDYASTVWALAQKDALGIPCTQVQHHYAHILSVMAVNQTSDKVLGFSFDGTGLGEERQLWGGEAMIADVSGYQRVAHLSPMALIGGEQAIKDPRRIMLALLFERYSPETLKNLPLKALSELPTSLIGNLHTLWHKGVATQMTSSIGRLFDATACLLNLMQTTQFEGQAGMLIEAKANEISAVQLSRSGIVFSLTEEDGVWQLASLWEQMVNALQHWQDKPDGISLIARAFMNALAQAVTDCARKHSALSVALCGGVFQNRYLLSETRKRLSMAKIKVLDSHQVPVNDGGIALGQLWYAIHQDKEAQTSTENAFR
ncbi:carbamoyltransferase HypF [Shewanella sp. Isolate7]|uniref:carbamoyltransferase HypF n=1 Tax=Shewanella sp. Isolate7 TaxID=2908528 RepID=UPI001EFE48F7|nr:carbamoyltransferase HypF [Shewanella sp. Isolate7]MCG9723324.1 carbamoyltransferase HypF [Shewanella sp. Isolate7]